MNFIKLLLICLKLIKFSNYLKKLCLRSQDLEPTELFKPLLSTISTLRGSYLQNLIVIRTVVLLTLLYKFMTTCCMGQDHDPDKN